MVATPDGDLYEEELGPAGCDGLLRAGVLGGVPAILRTKDQDTYRFEGAFFEQHRAEWMSNGQNMPRSSRPRSLMEVERAAAMEELYP